MSAQASSAPSGLSRYVNVFGSIRPWVGEPPGLCVHSETCGLALALEHTGDLYSCDHGSGRKWKQCHGAGLILTG